MIWLLIVLLVMTGAVLLACRFCYRRVFAVDKAKLPDAHHLPDGEQYEKCAGLAHELIDSALAIPFEEVRIRSHDGLTLYGRFYHKAEGAPVQILFHGYRSNAYRDFCGGLELALGTGCNAILVDQSAHGNSEGKCLSFGVLERQDCLAWVNYVIARFGADTKIILSGISMGAATVVMAGGLGLPANVKGILADSGYTSPKKIICKVLAESGYPVKLVYPLIRLGGRIFGGFDVEAASSEDAVKQCKLPMLLIHGEDDRFVPCNMSRALAESAADADLLTVPGAGHGLSFMVDNAAYCSAVAKFLKKC